MSLLLDPFATASVRPAERGSNVPLVSDLDSRADSGMARACFATPLNLDGRARTLIHNCVTSELESVAILGSGMAGLTAARSLHNAGVEVHVFDKGRFAGGRLATREHAGPAPDRPFRFDHGAQFFTAKTASFSRRIEGLVGVDAVASWEPRRTIDTRAGMLVGMPSMRQLGAALAKGLVVRQRTAIDSLRREGRAWFLRSKDREFGPYGSVLTTAPAPQSARLLEPVAPHLHERLGAASYAPCLTLMLGFERALPAGIDAGRFPSSEVAWAARTGSKPGNATLPECWVAHASVAHSRANLETDVEQVASPLVQRFFKTLGVYPRVPQFVRVHRWRYARVERALDEPFLFDPSSGLGAAGDFCLGPRVELAHASGLALAERLLEERGLNRTAP